jgi:exopolysaccharide biosynthesis operon protein EpsL
MLNYLQSGMDNFGGNFILPLRRSLGTVPCKSLLRAGSVALIGSLFSVPALAELSDTLHPFVSASINHDDNLFRLSDDRLRLIDGGADTYRSVIGGLNFKRPVERQLFSGTAKFSRVNFDRNSQLDYTGKDLSGEWRWFLAAHFDGHIGGSYKQVLASFSDFHSDQLNVRVTKTQYADGTWRFHPSWQLRTGYTNDRYTYDLVSERNNDRTEEAGMAGVDYLAASGSTIGFQFRRLKGSYPYQQSLGAGFDNGYVQQEEKINILWLATGSTQVMFLGGWVQRKHNFQADRDDIGTNGRLIVNWAPVERVNLVAQTWREFGAIEGALVNSALSKGASGGATWDFSAKIQAVANLKHEKREFTPFSGAGVLLSSASLSDSSNLASVGLVYKPLRSISLQASAFRDRRSGSAAAGTNSYKANGASFNASVQF